MNDWIGIGLSLLGGAALGLLYFGGLWWTVLRLRDANRPLALYLASLGIRIAICLLSLSAMLQVGVVYMLAALVGFFVARLALVRGLGFSRQLKLERNAGGG